MQGFVAHSSILISQRLPSHPGSQVHENELIPSWHIPLKHGLVLEDANLISWFDSIVHVLYISHVPNEFGLSRFVVDWIASQFSCIHFCLHCSNVRSVKLIGVSLQPPISLLNTVLWFMIHSSILTSQSFPSHPASHVHV